MGHSEVKGRIIWFRSLKRNKVELVKQIKSYQRKEIFHSPLYPTS